MAHDLKEVFFVNKLSYCVDCIIELRTIFIVLLEKHSFSNFLKELAHDDAYPIGVRDPFLVAPRDTAENVSIHVNLGMEIKKIRYSE